MHLAVAAGSDVGRVRKGNEDAFHADANEFRGLFIVADGMGGHAAGEVASRMAVETISAHLAGLRDLESAEALQQVAESLRRANHAVYERTVVEREMLGMGSTASLLLLSDERYIVGHVGDSRIYVLRDGELRQITHDHSLVQERVDAGLLSPEEARHHPQSNVITRCVGIAAEIEPDVMDGDVRWGDIFLLASDGLTGMVNDRRLQQLLASRATPARLVDALIAEANGRGGTDNITAVVVQVRESLAHTGQHPTQHPTPLPGAGAVG